MILSGSITFLKVLLVVVAVLLFSRTQVGGRIGKFLPTPFWIYFLSIVGATIGFLPSDSAVYGLLTLYGLSIALLLMLVGTPITLLFRIGPKALLAMSLSMVGMVVATLMAYVFLHRWLPNEAWKAAGALLGTWIGGSANMLAVKSILAFSDDGYAPLILVDTFLSYSWMALLMLGAAYQKQWNAFCQTSDVEIPHLSQGQSISTTMKIKILWGILMLAIMGGIACILVAGAAALASWNSILTKTAWALLLSSMVAVILSLTPMHRFERRGASSLGQWMLYLVLVSIGAKTTLGAAVSAPIYFVFGGLILFLHGGFMLVMGRLFRLPLMLLSTASQAAVGGPVSAPIVAEVYNPSLAHIGVLMAILGAVLGTYAGVAGAWLCQVLGRLIF